MSAAAETMRLSAHYAVEGPSGDAGCAALARAGEGGTLALHLMVEGAHCGGCVRRIERALAAEPDVAFLWAIRSGQFDDLDGAAERILFDDDDPPGPPTRRERPEADGRADPDREPPPRR